MHLEECTQPELIQRQLSLFFWIQHTRTQIKPHNGVNSFQKKKYLDSDSTVHTFVAHTPRLKYASLGMRMRIVAGVAVHPSELGNHVSTRELKYFF